MACEKKGVCDVPSVVCTAPEKEKNSENNQTRLRVLGAVTVVAIVVAGVLGVTYVLSKSTSTEGGPLDGSKDGNGKEVLVEFNFQGKPHNELIHVDEDQNLVTITDTNSGFSVTLDNERGVAMIKNTTSSDCFFTRLEYIPKYQTNDIKTMRPIVVQEVANLTSPRESNDDEQVTLLRSDVIPQEYVQVSNNPDISKQCIESTSYWLKGNPFTSRERRAKPDPNDVPWERPPDIVIIRSDGVIVIYIRC